LVSDRYFYAVGRRKTATAQVRLYPEGEGSILVNGRPLEEYFCRTSDLLQVREPLAITDLENAFNITVLVKGGGQTGQAGAVRHGLSRALVEYDADLRPVLRRGGFLTRDARMKERKKPGLVKARRAKQYTKR